MQEWYLGREKVPCLERCPQFRSILIERERFHCDNFNPIPTEYSLEQRCREKREEVRLLNDQMEEQKRKEETTLLVSVSVSSLICE